VFIAAVLVLTHARPAAAYIAVPYTLGKICSDATNIVMVRVEKVDRTKNLIIYRKVRDIKGKHPTEQIKHNIGKNGFFPREYEFVMADVEVGRAAVIFHNGGASETCLGRYWYQAYAGGDWWSMSHGEPFLLRSYCGDPDRLAAAVAEIHAGRETIVPAMVDGNQEALHLRKARVQRLRASLRLADYNPRRDFVGWMDDLAANRHPADMRVPHARTKPRSSALGRESTADGTTE
jgi:hypothetical protein